MKDEAGERREKNNERGILTETKEVKSQERIEKPRRKRFSV